MNTRHFLCFKGQIFQLCPVQNGDRAVAQLHQPLGGQLPQHPAHRHPGQAVGLSRVTVSRVLGELSDQGLVELGYRAIVILQRDELHQLAYSI